MRAAARRRVVDLPRGEVAHHDDAAPLRGRLAEREARELLGTELARGDRQVAKHEVVRRRLHLAEHREPEPRHGDVHVDRAGLLPEVERERPRAGARLERRREEVLAVVLLHVVAPPGRVDAAGNRARRRRAAEDVQHLALVLLDVEHRDAAERPAVGGLPSALGVEGRAVEHHGGGSAAVADGDDAGVELDERGVLQVEPLGHAGSLARAAPSRARVHRQGMKVIVHAQHLALPRDSPVPGEARHPSARPASTTIPRRSSTCTSTTRARSKGGVDQECRLSFRMPGARTVPVEACEDDLYKALLDAAPTG